MNSLAMKRKIAQFWPEVGGPNKLILLYHSIGDSPWGLALKQFREQIAWLCDHCEVVSLTQLLQSKTTVNQVAITFDDGYDSLYEHALPVLHHKKCSATVYLNTGWIGEENQSRRKSDASLGHYPQEHFLTWCEVKALFEAQWEVGSHGVNHHCFPHLSDEIMEMELRQSKEEIERRLNKICEHFAYPWGRYSAKVKASLKKTGYHFAASARHGKVEPQVDVLALPRINIANNYSLTDFKNIIKGKWNFLGLIQRMKGL